MYVSSIFSAPKYLFCAKKTKISKATVIPLQNKIFWCVCLNCNKITTPSRDYKPSMGIVNQRLAENMVCSVSLFFPCLLRYHAPILSNGKVVAKIKQMEYFFMCGYFFFLEFIDNFKSNGNIVFNMNIFLLRKYFSIFLIFLNIFNISQYFGRFPPFPVRFSIFWTYASLWANVWTYSFLWANILDVFLG